MNLLEMIKKRSRIDTEGKRKKEERKGGEELDRQPYHPVDNSCSYSYYYYYYSYYRQLLTLQLLLLWRMDRG